MTKHNIYLYLLVLLSFELYAQNKTFTITPVVEPNTSIRAVHKTSNGELWFTGSNGYYGFSEDQGNTWQIDSIQFLNQTMHFRALGSSSRGINIISIESPGMIFRTENKGKSWFLSYYEEGEKVFYDAVKFYDQLEGIALGDPIDGCFSILKTYDGGETWTKMSCETIPEIIEGEAAFAASNTNIETIGDSTWIVTGGKVARVLFSPDRGNSWETLESPIISGDQMTGIYSVDFYNNDIGVIIGGDWNDKSYSKNNKAITFNGGKSWKLLSKKKDPPYQSCIKFIPNSNGKSIISVGIPGVYYSENSGRSWIKVSDESFYAVEFINSNRAILTGNKKISILTF